MINLALIGVGKWGKNYISTVSSIPDCQIKYQRTRDFADLLDKDDIDGVIIATPGATHFEISSQFLEKGFNLLIEKPLTTSLQEAEALLNIWTDQKPKVLVGITYLYHSAYQQLKSRLVEIGQIKSLEFQGLSSPIRDDIPALWDWGPHAVSLFLDLVKSPISKVSGQGQRGQANLEIEFENGVKATAQMKWVHPEKVRKLKIVGSQKTLEIDFSQPVDEPPLTVELKEFISAIKKNTPISSTLEFGVEVTKVLSQAEQSVEMSS